jgi:hypothetical protein
MINVLRGGAVLVLAAVASGAWAAETSIGGVSINLPAPAGFCELSASQPADNRALTTFGGLLEKSGNRLLGFFADCQQLADWRAGKRPLLDDYAQFQTPISGMDRVVASPKAFIHETCATLRAQGKELNSNIAPDVKSKIERALANVKMDSLEFVGVLAEDDTACYAAQIMNAHVSNGADKTQIVLLALAVVKSKFIVLNRYRVYVGADAASDLLAKWKDTVAALYAANK